MEHATPDYSHLSTSDYDYIYEPSEDTFLLMDSLEKDVDFIKHLHPSIICEVGCGSGVVAVFLASLLKSSGLCQPHCIVTDINECALTSARVCAMRNGVHLDGIQCDLMSPLTGKVDVIVCNPPYVPTKSTEIECGGLVASWAGGVCGREVIDRLLDNVPNLLTPRGIFYLLLLQENDFDDVLRIMDMRGFQSRAILSRRAGSEFLRVFRFMRDGS